MEDNIEKVSPTCRIVSLIIIFIVSVIVLLILLGLLIYLIYLLASGYNTLTISERAEIGGEIAAVLGGMFADIMVPVTIGALIHFCRKKPPPKGAEEVETEEKEEKSDNCSSSNSDADGAEPAPTPKSKTKLPTAPTLPRSFSLPAADTSSKSLPPAPTHKMIVNIGSIGRTASSASIIGKSNDRPQSGRRTYRYPNGMLYDGEWLSGKRHGQGLTYHPGGARYEGQYVDDMRHGKGTQTASSGDRYEGEFRNDRKHGRGVFQGMDGSSYDGDWRDGKKHGRGVFVGKEGSRFEGQYVEDQRHGVGRMTFVGGKTVMQEYRNGKLV